MLMNHSYKNNKDNKKNMLNLILKLYLLKKMN